MKKRRILLLTMLPLFAATIVIPTTIISCSTRSNNNGDTNQIGTVGVRKYNSKQQVNNNPSTLKLDTRVDDMFTNVLDPNLSLDAYEKANETFKNKLTVESLQKDFDVVLSKFYKIAEFESETTNPETREDTEVDAKISTIKVSSIDKEKLTAQLQVSYKVDNDIDEDKIETKEVEFKIIPAFATDTEIKNITNLLTGEDQEIGNIEIDIEDLRELYIGEPEDNEKSIFEQVAEITKNQNTNYGGLLGYKINIADLVYKPSIPNTQTFKNIKEENSPSVDFTNFHIFAPSSVITEYFVPDEIPSTGELKLDFTFDLSKLQMYTANQIITNIGNTMDSTNLENMQNKTGKEFFASLLKNSMGVVEAIETIKAENVPTKSYISILIQLKNTTNMENSTPNLVTLGISYDWVKPETPSMGGGSGGDSNGGTNGGNTNNGNGESQGSGSGENTNRNNQGNGGTSSNQPAQK